ncbi:glucose dehydrogenase [FAD, quinone]-like [Anticarsia gemmatalis]|uniref:glucose dehydrogenase [FAD, quinone]-like n=1 Tax=Anticarsia gemmatalis TaxID=129554 RepID=UPI003F7714B4
MDEPSKMMIEAFHEAGLPIADYNGPNQETTFNAQGIAEAGIRVSANNALIQPIRYKRKNLTVKIKSEVFKLLINRRKIAYGVQYERNGRTYTAYARKEVILCAGAIDTPKILMLSGIGPRKHLSSLKIPVIQDLAVGENLHDHVTFNGMIIALNKTSTWIKPDEILEEICKYDEMKVKHGPLAANGVYNALAFIKTQPHLEAPDIQFHIAHLYWKEYVRESILSETVPVLQTAYYDALNPRAMNLVPKSRGYMVLNATNPRGKPILFANYLGDPEDIEPVIRGYRFAISLEKTKAFKSRGAYFVRKSIKPCDCYEWASDEYFRCLGREFTSPTHHQVGTCKMGPSTDRKAVVDAKLRVYGISRLRVIDASIMPKLIRGNTNIPSMMIGERGVAFVLERWRKMAY